MSLKKIADLENNAVLLLIGAGETFEKVKEQVCEYGLEERVIFLGVRKDIASLYQAMDCFVFPSLLRTWHCCNRSTMLRFAGSWLGCYP